MSGRLALMAAIGLLVLGANAEDPPRDAPSPAAKAAIARGIEGLRRLQRSDGSFGPYGVGSTALAGVALVEAGVPFNDPAIMKALKFVRFEAGSTTYTYSIALATVFLDRAGDANDADLVKHLANRLVRAQRDDGGWNYYTAIPTTSEFRRDFPSPFDGSPDVTIDRRDRLAEDPNKIADNSNTTFAILGLWAGHRRGADVSAAIKRAEVRFRRTFVQLVSGIGWGYHATDAEVTGARSCAGLLGLATAYGIEQERALKSAADSPDAKPQNKKRSPLTDPLCREGLKYLASEFAAEVLPGNDPSRRPNYYFLWALERVAVIYGVQKLGALDWYVVGCQRIIPYQDNSGLWLNSYSPEVESSFALLFLSRSNLTKDLTTAMRGTSVLKSTPQPASEALADELVNSPAELLPKLLEEYRDKKGGDYTEALAKAIPRLPAEHQKTARNYLAERLSRMTAATLRDRFRDSDAEIRRATALAAAMKEDKQFVSELIRLLDDKDTWVVRAAGVALNRLTGEDYGPAADASAEERAKSVSAWKAWWRAQIRK